MYRLAIFASGEGTNAQKFIEYFKGRNDVVISLIVCNKSEAGVVQKAKEASIPILILNKEAFYNTDKVLNELKGKADFIVLAGFIWMVPENIISAFSGKMVNIHPALLPKYGGKGMYGIKVHEAVVANHENESGITIHYVNNKYDEGKIIFQAKCLVEAADTPEAVAKKIHELEYKFYPMIVDKLLLENIS
ncbi:MAG TPA: phosphoribosylglycinamide formyltransferase [Bacteroidia bacterium]|nr:phosphoribosylglycinamide formyltransferase [Bacteroidia bacterium]